MKNLKKIFVFATIILLVIFIGTSHKVYAISDKQEEKVKKFNQTENIVFLGDSLFDLYKTEYIFDDLPIVNSGIAGNTTSDILSDMENRIYKYNPTRVFLLIGINDFYGSKDKLPKEELIDTITNRTNEIIDNIKKNRPKCKIYLVSLLPINDNLLPQATPEFDREVINEINFNLRTTYEDDKMLTYIDANSKLQDENGLLREEYTREGLHLNDLGYTKFTEILMKYIYQ